MTEYSASDRDVRIKNSDLKLPSLYASIAQKNSNAHKTSIMTSQIKTKILLLNTSLIK